MIRCRVLCGDGLGFFNFYWLVLWVIKVTYMTCLGYMFLTLGTHFTTQGRRSRLYAMLPMKFSMLTSSTATREQSRRLQFWILSFHHSPLTLIMTGPPIILLSIFLSHLKTQNCYFTVMPFLQEVLRWRARDYETHLLHKVLFKIHWFPYTRR